VSEPHVVAVEADFSYVDGSGQPKSASIDVVSGNGTRWVESKDNALFGLNSSTWTDDILPQATRQLEAAEQNPVNGQVPQVVYRFNSGVTQEVAAALEAMGIEVLGTQFP